MSAINKLVLIGNGFDLAHGLKTSYKNFLDWYMCEAFKEFCTKRSYVDLLFEIKDVYSGMYSTFNQRPVTSEEVLKLLSASKYHAITYKSNFFRRLIELFHTNNWVDIEYYYFKLLKSYFSNPNFPEKKDEVPKLNKEFDFIIKKLTKYIQTINKNINDISKLDMYNSDCNLNQALSNSSIYSKIKFLNFNYTETLYAKRYADESDIIHIHGRAADAIANPIIFGYGDETDPAYQNMEDSGENMYLEHIKSFGYFKTNNYTNLISYIDSAPYIVYIVGHSCGLSDRILLNEIFEHTNCKKIEIFYYRRQDETDNFTEITQEISRHFKPQNKGLMRRKLISKSDQNIIPQN